MRPFLAPLALTAALASPVAALDFGAMSEAEREAFRAEVRSYLIENPEVLMEAIAVLEDRQAMAEAAADQDLARNFRAALFDDPDSWVGGNPDGDITVVEFIDYRCGFCKRAHPEVADLVEGDGNIRYIIREFPILGEQSVMASRFALAVKSLAGDDSYKLASDALMAQRNDVTEATLTELAQALDLDPAEVLAEMEADYVTAILADTQQLARQLNISGTPTFVFEDQFVRGYAPLPYMKDLVADLRRDG